MRATLAAMSAPEELHVLCTREACEAREQQTLSPLAVLSAASRGRSVPEERDPLRTEFQRDRDRILHSTAFRRLIGKTQVFISDAGDHYRVRLTHSLEVSQIARSIARALKLNEDLCEALALAHDLGHAPFGHVGGDVLDELMRAHGGFEHNRQALRIMERLEVRSPGHAGVNLTYEVRESILKHKRPFTGPEYASYHPEEGPCLEAQVVDFADGIAYNSHDVDDALRSGLLDDVAMSEVELWCIAREHALARNPGASGRILQHKTVASLITLQVTDLVNASLAALNGSGVKCLRDVRARSDALVGFSATRLAQEKQLRAFLHRRFYTHYKVCRMRSRARVIVSGLFQTLQENPRLLPPRYQQIGQEEGLPRAIADYIAGMTDRYAQKEYALLLQPGQASLEP